jgi:hypothetical protein
VSYEADESVPDIRHHVPLVHVLRYPPTQLSIATGTSEADLESRVRAKEGLRQAICCLLRLTGRLESLNRAGTPVSPDLA